MTWKFIFEASDRSSSIPTLHLMARDRRHVATVYLVLDGGHYNWHTWDAGGCGGENSCGTDPMDAMKQAYASVVRQGFHKKGR